MERNRVDGRGEWAKWEWTKSNSGSYYFRCSISVNPVELILYYLDRDSERKGRFEGCSHAQTAVGVSGEIQEVGSKCVSRISIRPPVSPVPPVYRQSSEPATAAIHHCRFVGKVSSVENLLC
ncbi:hypothetical protein EVAR_91554_1 [Eumeta japonica]|uniref:Uncharacterized protein n=1 Tax=Eumeta variegata TaxID=151549 RepID=A0A4C1XAR4_EUMVA|nr:hypothetical protein EVAR_91554_1 [Eumeta japonica]